VIDPTSKVNRLLARLFQEPDLLARIRNEPEAVFDEAGLSQAEKDGLAEGSFAALARIGVLPTLRMHYQMAANPQIADHVTVKHFLRALEKERRHG